MSDTSVTICTVSYETGALVHRNVALTRHLNPGTDVPWIVVDNTPPDGPDRVAPEPGIDLRPAVPVPDVSYQAPSFHHGAGLNSVVPGVTTRHVLVTDPDLFVVLPAWIERVRAHVERTGLAFFGVPWHPRWIPKPRGFPAPHFLWIDGSRVDLTTLDFRPQGELTVWERVLHVSRNRRRVDRAVVRVLPDWMERCKIGVSRDTGSRLTDQFSGVLPSECLLPYYDPPRHGPVVGSTWRSRVAEQILPSRFRLVAPKSTWSSTGFRSAGLPDVDARGWEEFLWGERPFAFHVRGYPLRYKGNSPGDVPATVDEVLASIPDCRGYAAASLETSPHRGPL